MFRFLSSNSFPWFPAAGLQPLEGKGSFFDPKEGRRKDGYPFLLAEAKVWGRETPLAMKLLLPSSFRGGGKWEVALSFISKVMRGFPTHMR